MSQYPHHLNNIPSFQDKLIGRANELERVRTAFQTAGNILLLNGMGGVGKTALAMSYVKIHGSEYDHIAWVEQTGDFATSLLSDSVLLPNLGVSLSGDLEGDTKLTLNKIDSIPGRNLLVIDNAEEGLRAYHKFLPTDWDILITSRQDLDLPQQLTLNFLDEEGAIDLFQNHYKREQDKTLILEIVKAVDLHTLTVEILAKTAHRQRLKLKELKKLLSEKGIAIGVETKVHVPHGDEEHIEKLGQYLKDIFNLSEVSENEDEVWLLKQFAALPPYFHSFDLLSDLLLEKGKGKQRLISALASLKEKGWLLYEEEEDVFKMHRVVQSVVVQLGHSFDDIMTLMGNVSRLLQIDQAKDNPVDKFTWLPYGKHLSEIVWEKNHEDVSEFLDRLRWVYGIFGEYQTAVKLGIRALEINESIFDEGHENRAILQSNLAIVYRKLGEYEKARDLLELSLSSDLSNYGETHPSVAVSQSNLATVYSGLGEYEKARDLLESALSSDVKNFGETHPRVATHQSNLAIAYRKLGEYEKARDLLEKALSSELLNFGERHPTLATTYNNLAHVEFDLDNFKTALKLFQKALNLVRELLGEEHPYASYSKNDIVTTIQHGAASGDAEMQALLQKLEAGELEF